jgi:subtilisin family serine protease
VKHFKIQSLIILLFGVSSVLVSSTSAQNYLVEDDNADPLYFDFIYAPPAKTPERTNFIKDEVVLLYPADQSGQINKITQKYNLKTASKNILSSVNTGIVVAKTNGQNPLKLSASINKREKIVEAATNNIYKPASTTFKNAYSMYETGVRAVHKTTKGKGITVCMVDTPVDIYHPSLSNALIETLDLFEIDINNTSSMLHGTSVAGVLVSQNPFIGIAPKAKLYAVGAFRAEKSHHTSLKGSSSDVAKAIDACIQHKTDVINLSFTGGRDSLVEKMVKKAIEKGIVVVAAAGNGGHWGSTIYPALIPGVLTATAIDENQKLFDMADKGNFIDYSAPGVNILTIAPGGKYKLATGTSISSAHVSGIVALLLSQKGNKNINKILTQTATDLGKPGRDPEYGDGLISASRALAVIKEK